MLADMSISPASLAATLLSMQSAGTHQAVATAMLKQQADAEASVIGLVEQALEASQASAPPPPGRGEHVDIRA